MTVALAGRAPATFEIKSANLPLVSLLLKSADLRALAEELKARFGDIPDFFDNDPLVLDLSPLQARGEESIDFPALLAMLRSYRVLPVAARGGTPGQMAAALAGRPRASARRGSCSRRETIDCPRIKVRRPNAGRARDRRCARPALVIDRPLRSGQQVYARGRDLVVLSHGQSRRRSHRRRPHPCLCPAAWQGHCRRPRQHRGAHHFAVPGTRTDLHRRCVPHQRSALPADVLSNPRKCGWSAAPRASW